MAGHKTQPAGGRGCGRGCKSNGATATNEARLLRAKCGRGRGGARDGMGEFGDSQAPVAGVRRQQAESRPGLPTGDGNSISRSGALHDPALPEMLRHAHHWLRSRQATSGVLLRRQPEGRPCVHEGSVHCVLGGCQQDVFRRFRRPGDPDRGHAWPQFPAERRFSCCDRSGRDPWLCLCRADAAHHHRRLLERSTNPVVDREALPEPSHPAEVQLCWCKQSQDPLQGRAGGGHRDNGNPVLRGEPR
mmetsp:Transcript_23346/g.54059  ORF Transcript_23346/g.54059 Transcript_23346/m.54059 type:complete len:246 (-) Transcript_23346:88-825(-)